MKARFLPAWVILLTVFSSPWPALGHGGDNMPSNSNSTGIRKKAAKPSHKTEDAALEEMSFLVRDLDKRMRRGDVEGVQAGAWEIAATADNLWALGEKKKVRAPNRMTINGYMNLLKSAAGELGDYEGKDDLETGRAQLANVREIFTLLHSQYHPEHDKHPVGHSASDSTGGKATPEVREGSRPDSGKPISPP